jgi:glycosyltransferase involved in cell wall biosynthesis
MDGRATGRNTDEAIAASVVVPAHNEEAVIGRLLASIADGLDGARVDVVVACNGCTDRTAEVARDHGARVVEVPEASKIAALDAGDAVARGFPRLYVDADVVLTGRAVRDLAACLGAPGALAAAAPVQLDTIGRPWSVRAFFRVWEAVRAGDRAPAGSGVYAMSAEGRARFDRFPDVIADDLFVHNLFARDERQTPATDPVVVEPPRSLRSLLRRRTRVYVGNMQVAADPALAALPGADDRGTAWWRVVLARPSLVPAAVPYVAVNSVAKLRARRVARRAGPVAWGRDDTTRAAAGFPA